MFYFDSTMLIILPALLLAAFAQMRVSSTFNRYKSVAARSGVTGAEMARALLQSEGVTNVKVERVSGNLTDHYDPRSLRSLEVLMEEGYWEAARAWIVEQGLLDLVLATKEFDETNANFVAGRAALQQALGLTDAQIEELLARAAE